MIFADSVKILRLMRQQKVGIYSLARRAGMSHVTIQKAIENVNPITTTSIFKIAEALGIDDYRTLIAEKFINRSDSFGLERRTHYPR